jgi:hypothetical protein
MRFEVEPDFVLTTDHAASSYGQPVLVDGEGRAHGPGDWPAGLIVRKWASRPERTWEEFQAARSFLRVLR